VIHDSVVPSAVIHVLLGFHGHLFFEEDGNRGKGRSTAGNGFDSAWTQFHVIAFNNDLWALNPARDHLIQMFPETFWRDITVLIGAATMLEAVLISGTSVAYLILSRPQEETQAPAEPTPALPHPQIDARPRIAPPNPKHYVH